MSVFDSIKVYDNVIPEDLQNFIHEYFMQNNALSWTFVENLTGTQNTNENKNKIINNPGLGCQIYQQKKIILPDAWFFSQALLNTAIVTHNIAQGEIIGARTFLQLPNGRTPSMANPHTDWNSDVNHTVVIYYICDSEGDTCLIDKTNKEIDIKNILNTDYKVIKKVSPKKGRLLIFDGSIYHASSSPEFTPRCVLNFNLKNVDVE